MRGVQFTATVADRFGLTSRVRVPGASALRRRFDPAVGYSGERGPLPDEGAALRAAFLARTSVLPGLADVTRTAASVRARIGPDGVTHLRAAADRVLTGDLDLLGHRGLDFGSPIDWHLDPTSGRRSPGRHWSRIRYLDPMVAGDKKVTWELNRLQHLLTLARAYAVTGEESYSVAIAEQLDAWIAANPPGQGINWASSLEVAYRAITWLWLLALTAESAAMLPAFSRSLPMLWLHGRHIETYLSTYFSPNTHLTGEALGLVYLGRLLPFKDAARWRQLGERILYDCLDWQVLPDGVYFEQSTYYQHYTVEIYSHFWLFAGSAERERMRAPLSAMLDFLMNVQRPDGLTPLIGDDDGGRLFPAGQTQGNDFRPALSTGSVLLERGDLKRASGGLAEETQWLLGPEGSAGFDRIDGELPATGSRAFPSGGYWILRDGWREDANYLIIDCGPHGGLRNYGHAHADALSIELCARGRPAIVDAGTHTYTGSASERDRFRAYAHNTLLVDGMPSSVPAGTFQWQCAARCQSHTWWTTSRADLFIGEHDGFSRLDPGLMHERSILFLHNEYWLIRDRTRGGSAPHSFELAFQCAPGTRVDLIGSRATLSVADEHGRTGPGDDALPKPAATSQPIIGLDAPQHAWHVGPGSVAPVYGMSTGAPRLSLRWHDAGGQDTLILALPGHWASARVERPATETGAAATVLCGDTVDMIVVGSGSVEVSTDRIVTDAALLWARLEHQDLVELVISGGSFARFDGRDVVAGVDPRSTEYRCWKDGGSHDEQAGERCAGSVA